jgi:hypothetical protein
MKRLPMTVRQLIEELQEIEDQDLPVCLDVNSWLENWCLNVGIMDEEEGRCVYLTNDTEFHYELSCTGSWVP